MEFGWLNAIALGFLFVMAVFGVTSVIGFFARAAEQWLQARQKINGDVPVLNESVRDLNSRVSLLETAVRHLERNRDQEAALGKARSDSLQTEAPNS
ncbi:MAG: hypothetical protein KIT09_31770 [Bryobacteraceae bacterium]|nr:hypothetical protein [Bryobacteraceae bacterium]